jgi:hypothetical protein
MSPKLLPKIHPLEHKLYYKVWKYNGDEFSKSYITRLSIMFRSLLDNFLIQYPYKILGVKQDFFQLKDTVKRVFYNMTPQTFLCMS